MFLSEHQLVNTLTSLSNLVSKELLDVFEQQNNIKKELEDSETNFLMNLIKSMSVPWHDVIKLQYHLSKNVNVSWQDTDNMEFMELYELFKIWQDDVKEENERRKQEEGKQGDPTKTSNNMFSQAKSLMSSAGNSFKVPKL